MIYSACFSLQTFIAVSMCWFRFGTNIRRVAPESWASFSGVLPAPRSKVSSCMLHRRAHSYPNHLMHPLGFGWFYGSWPAYAADWKWFILGITYCTSWMECTAVKKHHKTASFHQILDSGPRISTPALYLPPCQAYSLGFERWLEVVHSRCSLL